MGSVCLPVNQDQTLNFIITSYILPIIVYVTLEQTFFNVQFDIPKLVFYSTFAEDCLSQGSGLMKELYI